VNPRLLRDLADKGIIRSDCPPWYGPEWQRLTLTAIPLLALFVPLRLKADRFASLHRRCSVKNADGDVLTRATATQIVQMVSDRALLLAA